MNKNEILKCLQNWENIRPDSFELIKQFDQGNSFFYRKIDYGHKSVYIHAYPGVTDHGDFKFFLIPAYYDSPEFEDTFSEYVQVCHVSWMTGSGEIDVKIATERIELWENGYQEWTHGQVKTEDGIFMAFQMRSEDFITPEVETQVTLGLRANGQQYTPFSADLIVVNLGPEQVKTYDDFNNPVPPFDATASADQFYLLSLVQA